MMSGLTSELRLHRAAMKKIKTMINLLSEFIRNSIKNYVSVGEKAPQFNITIPIHKDYGDFSTGVAFNLAPLLKRSPYDIAVEISERMRKYTDFINKADVVKPGYINFLMNDKFWRESLLQIISADKSYGTNNVGTGKKVLIEFVSANPTGPIHVGHGRGAVVGDVLARVLSVSGFNVTREYYVNDAGGQVLSLGYSLLNEYYRLNGLDLQVSDKGEYAGDYIRDLSVSLISNLEPGYINEEHISAITEFAVNALLETIKGTLREFGIEFDNWFSEKAMHEDGSVSTIINELEEKKTIKQKDGAIWFTSALYGDEKDRVLKKRSGELTYFASDIAYHVNKLKRGYDMLINVWGADHHGYLPRIRAALRALGYDSERLEVLFIQMVKLVRENKPVAMSKRAGEYIKLKELIDEVGSDAVRFFFLQRSHESQLTFDIELAKKQSQENPVYYVQYAHARIANIFEYAITKGWDVEKVNCSADYRFSSQEKRLIAQCLLYPMVVKDIAVKMEPHRLTHYLVELVVIFHKYYTDTRVVDDDDDTAQRLLLIKIVKIVLRNALSLLGIRAPEKM